MLKFLKNKKADIFFILFFIIIFILSTGPMASLADKFAKLSSMTVKSDLLLCSVISLGLLGGRKKAAFYGIIVGFIFDIFIGNPYAFSPLVFLLCGYFADPLSAPFSHRTPLSVLLVAGMLLWIKSLFSFFYLIAVNTQVGVAAIIFKAVLPEYLINAVACALVFAVMRILMALFRIPVSAPGQL